MAQELGSPGKGGIGGTETIVTTRERGGSSATSAASQNSLMQALAVGFASKDLAAASRFSTAAAVGWNATASAICHEPPRRPAAVARVRAQAVGCPAEGVMVSLSVPRACAQTGCAASQNC